MHYIKLHVIISLSDVNREYIHFLLKIFKLIKFLVYNFKFIQNYIRKNETLIFQQYVASYTYTKNLICL